jgi:hypothetical protein
VADTPNADHNGAHPEEADPSLPIEGTVVERSDSDRQNDAAQHNRDKAKRIFRAVISWFVTSSKWLHNFDGWVTAIATVVLAALTYVLANYASHQEVIIKDQQSDSRLINRAAVFESHSDAATGAAQNGSDTTFIITVFWENSGNTQTVGMLTHLACPSRGDKTSPPFDREAIGKSVTAQRTLGPKQSKTAARCTVSKKTLAELYESGGTMWVQAYATYADIFGEKHVTEVCERLVINGNLMVIPDSAVSFEYCDKHNCADDECSD